MLQLETRLREPELAFFKVIERTENGLLKLCYQRIRQPYLMTDRDNMIAFESRIEKAPNTESLWAHAYYQLSVHHPEYPETKEAVRQLSFKKTLLWQEGTDVRMIELANFNPRGNIPSALAGLVIPPTEKGLDRIRDICCKKVE
jgi:hypothetical protein